MEEKAEIKKLAMTESGERELRLYYFITKFLEEYPDGKKKITEGVATILSFDLDRAVAEASRTLPVGTNIVMAGHKNVQELFDMIDVIKKAELEIKVPEEMVAKKFGKEEFKNGLLLAADTLISDVRDQKTIKRIVSKII
jgi:molybdenum cofactor biosynthesis enzyme MoaA